MSGTTEVVIPADTTISVGVGTIAEEHIQTQVSIAAKFVDMEGDIVCQLTGHADVRGDKAENEESAQDNLLKELWLLHRKRSLGTLGRDLDDKLVTFLHEIFSRNLAIF